MACAAAALAIALAAAGAPPARAGTADAALAVETARWESGYGVKFFQVVGTVTNRGKAPLGAVRVQTELLDAKGAVVASVECWNGRAEALGDLRGDAAAKLLADESVSPIAPGTSDKWRCTVLEEDAPAVSSHRARIADTLPAPPAP